MVIAAVSMAILLSDVQHTAEQGDADADESQDSADQQKGRTRNGGANGASPADSGGKNLGNGRKQSGHNFFSPFKFYIFVCAFNRGQRFYVIRA